MPALQGAVGAEVVSATGEVGAAYRSAPNRLHCIRQARATGAPLSDLQEGAPVDLESNLAKRQLLLSQLMEAVAQSCRFLELQVLGGLEHGILEPAHFLA